MMPRRLVALTAITATLVGTACNDDDDPTQTTETATVQATLVDGSSTQAVPDAMTRRPHQVQATYTGTFDADTKVEIYAPSTGAWVEVAGTSATQLDLSSTDMATLGSSSQIEAGVEYTRVRFTMSNAETVIDAGAILGGITLGVDVTMTLGSGGDVVVEKDMTPVTLQADATAALEIDLNSHLWVTEDNANAEAVTQAEVAAATTVTVTM